MFDICLSLRFSLFVSSTIAPPPLFHLYKLPAEGKKKRKKKPKPNTNKKIKTVIEKGNQVEKDKYQNKN